MAKKFGDITGIHKVFASADALLLKATVENPFLTSEVDENTIIYFVADKDDEDLFSSLGILEGVRYTWVHGRILGTEFVTKDGTQVLTGAKRFEGQVTFTKDPALPFISRTPVHTHLKLDWGVLEENGACFLLGEFTEENGLQVYKPLDIGSYIIQILHTTDGDGGVYTGYFSFNTGMGTNEEIILHRAGNISEQHIFAKVKYITNAVYLQLAASVEELDCTELTIKLRKLL